MRKPASNNTQTHFLSSNELNSFWKDKNPQHPLPSPVCPLCRSLCRVGWSAGSPYQTAFRVFFSPNFSAFYPIPLNHIPFRYRQHFTAHPSPIRAKGSALTPEKTPIIPLQNFWKPALNNPQTHFLSSNGLN